MIEDFFEQLGEWTWIVIGLVLLVLEIFLTLPGSLFLFTGIAAIIIGASALLFDWAWQFQLVGFAVLSLVLVVLGHRFFALPGKRFFALPGKDEDDVGLNERATRLIGTSCVLVEPIIGGHGRVKVGDSTWGVTGSDAPAGAKVRIVSADGAALHVELEQPA